MALPLIPTVISIVLAVAALGGGLMFWISRRIKISLQTFAVVFGVLLFYAIASYPEQFMQIFAAWTAN